MKRAELSEFFRDTLGVPRESLAEKLVERYGGDRLPIAKARTQTKRERIMELWKKSHTVQAIVEMVGCTPQWVRAVVGSRE
jgi:hypothetical protein